MKGDAFTKASDVYSFGMILYELICRKFPFSEFQFKFQYQQMDAICKDHLRPSLHEIIPLPLRKLIQSCWSVDIESRLQFTDILLVLKNINESIVSFNSFIYFY